MLRKFAPPTLLLITLSFLTSACGVKVERIDKLEKRVAQLEQHAKIQKEKITFERSVTQDRIEHAISKINDSLAILGETHREENTKVLTKVRDKLGWAIQSKTVSTKSISSEVFAGYTKEENLTTTTVHTKTGDTHGYTILIHRIKFSYLSRKQKEYDRAAFLVQVTPTDADEVSNRVSFIVRGKKIYNETAIPLHDKIQVVGIGEPHYHTVTSFERGRLYNLPFTVDPTYLPLWEITAEIWDMVEKYLTPTEATE